MFRSYRPSVKHLYTIRIAYTTPKVYSGPKTTRKKIALVCAFLRSVCGFFAPVCVFRFLRNGPKVPESAPKCRPNWVSESVRIGCPNSVSESVRIGCPNWVSYRCFKKVPASCMPCPGKRTFKIINYILLCSESRVWFAHGCGPCLRKMWLCYLWDDIWRILKISKNFASGHVSFNGSRSNRSRSDASSVICGSFFHMGKKLWIESCTGQNEWAVCMSCACMVVSLRVSKRSLSAACKLEIAFCASYNFEAWRNTFHERTEVRLSFMYGMNARI